MHYKLFLGFGTLLILVLTACASPSSPQETNKRDTPLTEEFAVLGVVNEIRSSGLCAGQTFPVAPVLTWNSQLFDAAIEHSIDMVIAGNPISSQEALEALLTKYNYKAQQSGYFVAASAAADPASYTAQASLVPDASSCAFLMSSGLKELGAGYWRDEGTVY